MKLVKCLYDWEEIIWTVCRKEEDNTKMYIVTYTHGGEQRPSKKLYYHSLLGNNFVNNGRC
jgi:hypothetical protein